MKVIGLTGNIGCGKSTVAAMLRELGVVTIDADEVARRVRNNDEAARHAILARFGTLDPRALGEVVFADPAALADLEAIVHPPLRDEIRARLAELDSAGVEMACIEAIKLLESPLHDRCDATWVVRCDEADALTRLAERGVGPDAVRARLANQTPQAAKIAAADVVIDGSAAPDETRGQVEAALRQLAAEAG